MNAHVLNGGLWLKMFASNFCCMKEWIINPSILNDLKMMQALLKKNLIICLESHRNSGVKNTIELFDLMIPKSSFISKSNRGRLGQGNFRMQSPEHHPRPTEWESVCFVKVSAGLPGFEPTNEVWLHLESENPYSPPWDHKSNIFANMGFAIWVFPSVWYSGVILALSSQVKWPGPVPDISGRA